MSAVDNFISHANAMFGSGAPPEPAQIQRFISLYKSALAEDPAKVQAWAKEKGLTALVDRLAQIGAGPGAAAPSAPSTPLAPFAPAGGALGNTTAGSAPGSTVKYPGGVKPDLVQQYLDPLAQAGVPLDLHPDGTRSAGATTINDIARVLGDKFPGFVRDVVLPPTAENGLSIRLDSSGVEALGRVMVSSNMTAADVKQLKEMFKGHPSVLIFARTVKEAAGVNSPLAKAADVDASVLAQGVPMDSPELTPVTNKLRTVLERAYKGGPGFNDPAYAQFRGARTGVFTFDGKQYRITTDESYIRGATRGVTIEALDGSMNVRMQESASGFEPGTLKVSGDPKLQSQSLAQAVARIEKLLQAGGSVILPPKGK